MSQYNIQSCPVYRKCDKKACKNQAHWEMTLDVGEHNGVKEIYRLCSCEPHFSEVVSELKSLEGKLK